MTRIVEARTRLPAAIRLYERSCCTGATGDAFMLIRNRIRRLRFDHGEMTQQELADKVGVTRQTINAIELGKYSPSLEVAFRIAAAFGVQLAEVFEYDTRST